MAAAAAAADGALLDAAGRWRGVAAVLDGTPGVWAAGRAALAAGLAGDVDAAARDLAGARRGLPDPAPRGLAVLLDGVDAVVDGLRGHFEPAARRLAGLAAATVPPDPLAVEPWDELAVTAVAASGDDRTARAMLGAQDDRGSPRRRLLAAWLDLRTGRLAAARDGLARAAGTPVLRRSAVLAAAVTVGLARRSGDDEALAATWHRVAPVMAGADVELLLLDVWGELSVGAALVAPADRDAIVEAMRRAVVRAGSPAWCVAVEQWWHLERAAAVADPAAAGAAAERLTVLAAEDPRLETFADAAVTWAAVLAGNVHRPAVARTAAGLAAAGRRWEAAGLCAAAAARATDPAVARELLGAGRGLRAETTGCARTTTDGLSERERDVGALVLDGLTHKEIGARLYISPKTVEQHVARLRQKLAASNRATLVAALRTRLER